MAVTSFPFDNQDTTEVQYSTLFRELQDSGVVDSLGALGFKVSGDGSGMNVKVQPGLAFVRGHVVSSTAVETLVIAGSEPAATRIDRIVLQLDPALNTIVLAVKKGTPGGGIPTLTQTDTGVFEIGLGYVTLTQGVTNVSAGSVTDERRYAGTRVGAWTTATRPSTPRYSRLGLNSTTSRWEYWNGSAWVDLAPSVHWDNIEGKPSSFSAGTHTHPWDQITSKPTTFTPTSHTHSIAQVTDLQNQLDLKSSTTHQHHARNIFVDQNTSVQTEINNLHNNKSNTNHGHDFYGQTTIRSDGTARAHAYAIGGGGNWYSVWVDGGGWFCRNTSSIRYKENVREADFTADDVLALVPRIYDRKDDVAPDGTPRIGRKDEFGLIAEEVAETMPELVQYEDGEIDSVRYDLIGVALLRVVQEQQAQIDELTRRLDEMQ